MLLSMQNSYGAMILLLLGSLPSLGSVVEVSTCSLTFPDPANYSTLVAFDNEAGPCSVYGYEGSVGLGQFDGSTLGTTSSESYFDFTHDLYTSLDAAYTNDGNAGFASRYSLHDQLYETWQTSGPERAGQIDILKLVAGLALNGGTAFVGISDGVHTYSVQSSDSGTSNGPQGYLPFDLGTPFSIYLELSGSGGTPPFNGGSGGGDVLDSHLYELDGITPVDATIAPEGVPGLPLGDWAVPEPSTLGLGGIVVGFLSLCRFASQYSASLRKS